MIDWFESLESAAEARLDEITEGLPASMARCDCGAVVRLDDMHPSGPNPFAEPICGECLERAIKYWSRPE